MSQKLKDFQTAAHAQMQEFEYKMGKLAKTYFDSNVKIETLELRITDIPEDDIINEEHQIFEPEENEPRRLYHHTKDDTDVVVNLFIASEIISKN